MESSPQKHEHALRGGPHPNDVAYVSCIKHFYADGASVEMCGLDFCAHKGERTVLLGPNGAGKSTLLEHLLGLLRPQEGTVRVFGLDPTRQWPEIRERIGVVLQNVDQQLIMPTVYDDIAFSLRQYHRPQDTIDPAVQRVAKLLGVKALLHRTPQSLSGGEKRRVALAGALAIGPDLLILDEPFEGLDSVVRKTVVDVLCKLKDQGVSMVMSTHDIDSIGEIADYCYVLASGGEIVLAGTPDEIFEHVDVLRESHIHPPILAEMFTELSRRTKTPFSVPLTIPQAVEELVKHFPKK